MLGSVLCWLNPTAGRSIRPLTPLWRVIDAVHAVVGANYLLSREHLVGLDIRPFLFPLAQSDLSVQPAYVAVTARFS